MARASQPQTGYTQRRKPRWWLIALIVLGHVAVLFGLARALAPDFTQGLVDQATSLVTVTVETREIEEEPPAPEPDQGASGEEGKQAVPREVTAPEVQRPPTQPAPRASSTGTANTSGASEQGTGTGAGDQGEGTGGGNAGSGQGGGIATGPSVRSGSINAARDFPVPEGGREVRYGTSVIVEFTVGVNGRAYDCSVTRPGPDPATNALVCPLVIERIRFNPARDAAGNPVPARYGWRQDFFAR